MEALRHVQQQARGDLSCQIWIGSPLLPNQDHLHAWQLRSELLTGHSIHALLEAEDEPWTTNARQDMPAG